MKKPIALIILVALAFGGWYLASPWWAMKSLADAARAQDVAALEERVDFPALRASAADQVTERIRSEQGRGGLVDLVGGAAAERIGRELLDRTLTPSNVGSLVATGALATPLLPGNLRGQDIAWEVERDGLDHFGAVGTFADGTQGPTLIFTRNGLGWKLTGFDLPDFGS